MRILIVNTSRIPVFLYGGTERVVWGLGKELSRLGHEVTFLVKEGSTCDFAAVRHLDETKGIVEQIDNNYDLVHFICQPKNVEALKLPYLITIQGNANNYDVLDVNTVFVSKNHAERYGSASYVHNGLDWSSYTPPDLNARRTHFHFLGKAAWRVKNVVGAIDVIKKTRSERLMVMGGVRFNFNMGLRLTFSRKVRFAGMVGGAKKDALLNASRGLIFPVRWHEPFGLAITESLFYGCPVFGTTYGSLAELVHEEVGFLSNQQSELTDAVLHADQYSKQRCHEYARDLFDSSTMTTAYLKLYARILQGQQLNPQPPQLKMLQKEKFLDWN